MYLIFGLLKILNLKIRLKLNFLGKVLNFCYLVLFVSILFEEENIFILI